MEAGRAGFLFYFRILPKVWGFLKKEIRRFFGFFVFFPRGYQFIHTIARVVHSRAFYIRFVMTNFMASTLTCFAFCVPRRTDVDTLFFQEFVDLCIAALQPRQKYKNT